MTRANVRRKQERQIEAVRKNPYYDVSYTAPYDPSAPVRKIEDQLKKAQLGYEAKINEIAKVVFETTILPWLKKHHCSFLRGMGTWVVSDKNGNIIDEDDLPQFIYDRLATSVPAYNYDLGTYMPEWKG